MFLEKEKVIDNIKNRVSVTGLRVNKLSKTYNYYPFGITSDLDMVALKDIYLEVQQGELFALLG